MLQYLRVHSVDDDDPEVSVQERNIQAPNGVANLFRVQENLAVWVRTDGVVVCASARKGK